MAKSKKVKAAKTVAPSEDQSPKRSPHYPAAKTNNFRNWRLFRGIQSQKELAEMTVRHDPSGKGLIRGVICRLEKGEVRYNEDHLNILARTLSVAPRDLIGTNPFDAGDIFAVYAGLSDADKRRLAAVAQRLKKPAAK